MRKAVMTMINSLRETVERAITDLLDDPVTITGDRSLDDLGLDSLALVELTDTLAKELGRPLDDDLFDKTVKVDELIATLTNGAQA